VSASGTHKDQLQLRRIQRGVSWARHLSKATFRELFCGLVEAQQTWNRNPRAPLDRKEHCNLALAIRRFRKAWDTYPADDNVLFNSSIDDNDS
jgi:hypothetical protein